MNNRLQRIRDWPAVAAESGYQVEKVAAKYQVSSRTLRRYFLEHFKKTPKHCIDEWRAEAAARELERGEQVKAAASVAKMDNAPNFTRFFKRVEGTTPKKYMHQAGMSEIDKKSPKSTRNVRFGQAKRLARQMIGLAEILCIVGILCIVAAILWRGR